MENIYAIQLREDPIKTCLVCGCTDDNACVDEFGVPCHWCKDDLCSACVNGETNLGGANTSAGSARQPEHTKASCEPDGPASVTPLSPLAVRADGHTYADKDAKARETSTAAGRKPSTITPLPVFEQSYPQMMYAALHWVEGKKARSILMRVDSFGEADQLAEALIKSFGPRGPEATDFIIVRVH